MIPPRVLTGTLLYKWLDPNSVLRDLSRDTSPSRFVIAGSVGLGDAEFEITDQKFPQNPGTFINQINTLPRKLQIPIIVVSDSLGGLALLAEDLFGWFDTGDETHKRPGYLQVTRPDDTVRQIAAYKAGGGFTGDMHEGGVHWTRYVVELHCPDPYPTDTTDTVLTKATGYSNFSVLNQGTLECWPVLKLTGPFTSFLFDNNTAGKTVVGTVTITAGHYLIIDMRPSEQRSGGYSVYDDTGANRQSVITPGSQFSSLQTGTSVCGVSFGGSSGATQVELTYRARYRTLLR